jgi:hypothetical protein
MKLARVGIIAAAILAVSSVAFAQTPDFSGTWTPDAPAAAPGGGGGGGGRGGGMMGPMTVKHAGSSITIEQTRGENKIITTFKLDGSETVNKQMGRGGEVEVKVSGKWDGNKLIVSRTQAGQDGTPTTRTETWSMEGGNLVIERAGRGGEMMKTTYKKTT